jgi:hypothetical protein
MSLGNGEPVVRIRWWLVVLFVALGAGVIGAGAVIAYDLTPLKAGNASFWSGVLVNVGTSLLLAAALVWFERTIVARVGRQNLEAIDQAASRAATQVAEQTNETIERIRNDLSARVDDIDSRLANQRDRIRHEQEVAIAGLGEEISRKAMLDALRAAADINAIGSPPRSRGGMLVVPSGSEENPPLIRVTYVPQNDAPWGGVETVMLQTLHPEVILSDLNPGWTGTEWREDQSPEEIFSELAREMVRAGSASASRQMKASVFLSNLRDALRLAVEAREGDEDSKLSGEAVAEFIDASTLVTKRGVEFLEPLFTIEAWRFEHGSQDESGTFESIPPKPDGIDQARYDRAVDRGRAHFRGRLEYGF